MNLLDGDLRMRITLAALLLVIPFIFGALVTKNLMPGIDSPFTGVLILQSWGTAFLGFAAGALWGAAMKSDQLDMVTISLCLIPALWALSVSFWPNAMLALIIGMLVLQAIEFLFHRMKIIPPFWLPTCLVQNTVALTTLTVGTMA